MSENVFIFDEFLHIDWNRPIDDIFLLDASNFSSFYIEPDNVVEVCDERVRKHKVLSISSNHDDCANFILI